MKKVSVALGVVLCMTMLTTPMVLAAGPVESPTEPENPTISIEDLDVPLSDMPIEELIEPEVPLVTSPQTGMEGLSMGESLSLLSAAVGIVGAALVVRARQRRSAE